MPTKIFAIVGYTHWGKSHTLYDLFDRRQFFPLKRPITPQRFGSLKFTVINASNEDRPTKDYLERLQEVLAHHQDSDTIIVITISLIFNNGIHDAKAVFDLLNGLTVFDVNYILLDKGWFTGTSLSTEDVQSMEGAVELSKIHHFQEVINESVPAFSQRTVRIAGKITELL